MATFHEKNLTFELDDGRFVGLVQTEECLRIVIPAAMKWLSGKQILWNLFVVTLFSGLLLIGPAVLFMSIAEAENIPRWYRILMAFPALPLIIVFIGFMIALFSKTVLRFTITHFIIEKRLFFVPIWKRIPLSQVRKTSCVLMDDLYLDWPEDVVEISWGNKNRVFQIQHIKSFEDQKKLIEIIKSFLFSNNDTQIED